MGHFASECWSKRREDEVNLIDNEEKEPTLMLSVAHKMEYKEQKQHGVVLLNEEKVIPGLFGAKEGDVHTDIWYLDNGASNHMTGEKGKFFKLDESITGMVKFGDGSTVEIMGKGTILFQCKNGDQWALSEVYFIPKLCNNIISLGQMTEEGNEVKMAGDLLRVYDRSDTLLMRVKRS